MTTHAAWLAALARRLLHRDTFEMMVSPAIADLQIEQARGWRTYVSHYLGLAVVLGDALLRDWRIDTRTAFDFRARRDVWLVTMLWYTALTVLLAALLLKRNTPWHLLDIRTMPAVVVDAALRARLYASYVAVVAAVFLLSRRLTTVKGLVIGVVTVSLFFAAMNALASVMRQPLNQAIFETASTNVSAATLPPGEPSWARGDGRKWIEWRGRQAGQATTAAELVGWFASVPVTAVFFLPWGLVGLAVSRGRSAGIALRLVAVIITTMAFYSVTNKWEEENQFLQFLTQVRALTVAALIWIGVGPAIRLFAALGRIVGDARRGARPA